VCILCYPASPLANGENSSSSPPVTTDLVVWVNECNRDFSPTTNALITDLLTIRSQAAPPRVTGQSGRSLETRDAFDIAILTCIRLDCSGKNSRVPMAMR
jgi:hypothetical protein